MASEQREALAGGRVTFDRNVELQENPRRKVRRIVVVVMVFITLFCIILIGMSFAMQGKDKGLLLLSSTFCVH